jgi:hypothetical protein
MLKSLGLWHKVKHIFIQLFIFTFSKSGLFSSQVWCKVECGEEDLDWKVVSIPGKGLGVIAVHDIPAKTRIMVDRVLTEPEARMRPEVMDLCPEGETFEKKFQINQLARNYGPMMFGSQVKVIIC